MQCRWGDTHTMSIFRAAVDIALLFLSSDPCNNLDPALLLLFHISMWPAVTCMNNAYLSVTHCQHKETSMYACACAENPLGYSGPWGEICAVIYLLNLAALMCIISILVEAALLYMNGVIRNASITQGEQESSPNAIPPWVVIKITQEQQKSPHSKLEQARLNTATSPRPKGGGEAPQFTSRGGNPITTRNRITGVPSTGIQQRYTPRTPGEILMGITDSQAEAKLATLRNKIKSREELELPENRQWTETIFMTSMIVKYYYDTKAINAGQRNVLVTSRECESDTSRPGHRVVGGGPYPKREYNQGEHKIPTRVGGSHLGTPETPGEQLMGITDRKAEMQLRTIRSRITSFEDMQLPENKRWAESLLQALPEVRLTGAHAVADPEDTRTQEPSFKSLYAVRDFGPRDPTRESLRDHMRLLTSVKTTGDGNCHDRSTMISLTGREEGHLGIRLRNALFLIAHNDKITGGGTARDFHILKEIAQPGTYLSDEASALTALTLECPIAVVAPLGVQGAHHLCRLFVPPVTQPGAQVILKAWTGITVRHPPIKEIPNDSGQALYHYCTALAPDTDHIERLLSHLTYHPLLKEQAVGRNRAVFNPTAVPHDQIDVDGPPPTLRQPERDTATYAEVVRRGDPCNTCEPTPDTTAKTMTRPATGKKGQPGPRGQQRLDSWVTKTAPRPRPTVQHRTHKHKSGNSSCPPPTGMDKAPKGNRFEPLRESQECMAETGKAPWPIFDRPRAAATTLPLERGRRIPKSPKGPHRPWVFYLENTRGLTADNTVAEMEGIIATNKPDVVMFTETQLRTMAKGRGAKIHRHILGGNYVVYQSPASDRTRGQGVMIAIHRQIATQTTVTESTTPDELTGIVKQVLIHRQGWVPLAVTAVYMPCGIRKKRLSELYKEIRASMLDSAPDVIHVVGGDWNSELPDNKRDDRRPSTRDRTLMTFVEDAKLREIPRKQGHEHKPTFRDVSSIDKMFLRTPKSVNGRDRDINGHEEVIDVWGVDTTYTHSDHNALLTTITLEEHGLLKPGDLQVTLDNGEERLVLPLTKGEEESLKKRSRAELCETIAWIHQEAREMREEVLTPYMGGIVSRATLEADRTSHTDRIDAMAQKVTALLQGMTRIAQMVGRITKYTSTGQHYRPRATNRKRARLVKCRKQLRYIRNRIMAIPNTKDGSHLADPKTSLARVELPQGQTAASPAIEMICENGIPEEGLQQYTDKISEMERSTQRQISSIDRTHAKLGQQKRTEHQNSMLDKNQKKGNKMVMQPRDMNCIRGDLRAIRSREGEVLTDPEEIRLETGAQMTEVLKATARTGPTNMEREGSTGDSYPWPKEFKLITTANPGPDDTLDGCMRDPVMFQEVITSLSRKKAPGPDRVVNEMILALQDETKEAIHTMFQYMWIMKHTPGSWKKSDTILIFKEKPGNCPLQLGNYRPISLANTLYKLWTRCITTVLYTYAEQHHILSYSQAGFRRQHRTTQLLQLLTLALEDARATNQDIYLLMVDFTCAFNTINQEKLIQIMVDLGFTRDAADNVKELYTNASTCFLTPGGRTDPVPVERGTLQGDSLSPFLFLVYMEPLIRWLHQEARSYKFGILSGDDKVLNQLGTPTFADDMSITAGSLADLRVQAAKVVQYSNWGELEISAKKTVVTGVLYTARGGSLPGGSDDPTDDTTLRNRLSTIPLQQGFAQYLPPTEAFKLLGVHLTATLDSRPQARYLNKEATTRAARVIGSKVARGHKIRMLHTSIKPLLAYSFPLSQLSLTQVYQLDTKIRAVAKDANKQRQSMPSAMVHEDRDLFGLGTASIMVEYAHRGVQGLTLALRHGGILGTVTRRVMDLIQSWVRTGTMMDNIDVTSFQMVRRQLAIAEATNLDITWEGTPITAPEGTARWEEIIHEWGAKGSALSRRIAEALIPLEAVGVNCLHQIVTPDTARVIDMGTFNRLFGPLKETTKSAYKKLVTLVTVKENGKIGIRNRNISEEALKVLKQLLPNNNKPKGRGLDKHGKTQTVMTDFPTRPVVWPLPKSRPKKRRCAPFPEAARLVPIRRARPMSASQAKTARLERRRREARVPITPPCEDENVKGPHRTKKDRTGNRTQYKTRYEQVVSLLMEGDGFDGVDIARNTDTQASARAALLIDPEPMHIDRIDKRTKYMWPGQEDQADEELKFYHKWEVHWADSYATEWEQQVYKSLGYKVLDSVPVTMTQAIEEGHNPICDRCCKQDEERNALCDGCQKMIHLACMHERDVSRFEEAVTLDTEWYCWECRQTLPDNPTARDITRLNSQPHVLLAGVYRTRWAPIWEPESQLLKNPALRGQIEEYVRELEEYRALGPVKKHRPDAHLTAGQQQGVLRPTPDPAMKTIGEKCRENIRITTKPINPHLDIHPRGEYTIQIRRHQTYRPYKDKMTKQTKGYTEGPVQESACVYDPEGSLVGTLTLRRLAILRIKYSGTQNFEQEVAELLNRYKDGSRTTRINNHWTTPPAVMEVFMEANAITRERFASPLNFHPGMTKYWSMYEQDKLFGAEGDAFAHRYTGSSESNPEYEDTDMMRALARAAHSVLMDGETPIMTTLVLPAWDQCSSTSYLNWTKRCPAICQVMMRIPAQRFKFVRPTHWADNETLEGCPKWDVNIIIVANEKGFEKYYKCKAEKAEAELCTRLAAALNGLGPKRPITQEQVKTWIKLPREWRPNRGLAREQLKNTPPELGMHLPRGLRSTPRDDAAEVGSTDEDTIRIAMEGLRVQYPAGELRYKWKEMAYTDGSLRKAEFSTTLTGAAIYLPDAETGLKGQTIRIDPSPGGVQDTINRAELVALHELLKLSQGNETWNEVATDSLTSVRLIWKAVTNPANIRDHLHKEILEDIARLISERQTPFHIYKIKSHVGMIGNEMADLGANLATVDRDTKNHTGAAKYRPGHWVSTKPSGEGKEAQPGKAVSDLRSGLRRHAHAVHKLGDAKLDGIYASSWRDTIPIADTKISSLFVQRNLEGITEGCRRQALLYRTGGLVTQKTLHRWKKVGSPNCLLCGEMDGGHHAISGCPALSVPVTERHNQAGRIIAEAICSGRHGGRIVMMDIGNHNKLEESNVPAGRCGRYLPTHYFPQHLTEQERKDLSHRHRADIALGIKNEQGDMVLHLVEIKTCRDTSRDEQVERAQEQHAELRELLEAAGVKHEMHTITVGVSGTIYKDTEKTLRQLGVDKREVKAILRNLHVCMVKWIGTMLSIRNDKIMSCSRTETTLLGKTNRGHPSQPMEEPSWKRTKHNERQKRDRDTQGKQAERRQDKRAKPTPRIKRAWETGFAVRNTVRPSKRLRPNTLGENSRKRPAAWAPQPGAGGPSKRARGGGMGSAPTTIK